MNILLVENKNNIEDLTATVNNAVEDANTYPVTSAADAVETADRIKIDVAFLIIRDDWKENVFFAAEFAEKYPRTNIILCAPSGEYALNAWNINSCRYILNPVTEEKVRSAMSNLRYGVK